MTPEERNDNGPSSFQLPFKSRYPFEDVWRIEFHQPLKLLPAWIASPGVRWELLRWASAFFGRGRYHQDMFDIILNSVACGVVSSHPHHLIEETWRICRDCLVDKAVEIQQPRTMPVLHNCYADAVWAMTSSNIVALGSRAPPLPPPQARSSPLRSLIGEELQSESSSTQPFHPSSIPRRSCHKLVIEIIKAVHDEMRTVPPVSDSQIYFRELLKIGRVRDGPIKRQLYCSPEDLWLAPDRCFLTGPNSRIPSRRLYEAIKPASQGKLATKLKPDDNGQGSVASAHTQQDDGRNLDSAKDVDQDPVQGIGPRLTAMQQTAVQGLQRDAVRDWGYHPLVSPAPLSANPRPEMSSHIGQNAEQSPRIKNEEAQQDSAPQEINPCPPSPQVSFGLQEIFDDSSLLQRPEELTEAEHKLLAENFRLQYAQQNFSPADVAEGLWWS